MEHEEMFQQADYWHDIFRAKTASEDAILLWIEILWATPFVESMDHRGRLALHIACLYRASIQVIRALVEAHPEALRHSDDHGNNALHWCFLSNAGRVKKRCSLEVVRYLMEQNRTSVMECNEQGKLPIHLACQAGCSLEVIQLLCTSHHLSVSRRCAQGRLPLHYACMVPDNAPVIVHLVNLCDMAVHQTDEGGNLPLHWLLKRDWSTNSPDQLHLVELFRSLHPDAIHCSNMINDLPLHIACQVSSSLELIQRLVEWGDERRPPRLEDGNSPNVPQFGTLGVRGCDDSFPLHRSCRNRNPNVPMIQYMLNAFPMCVMGCDEDGNLPLHHLMNSPWDDQDHGHKRASLVQQMVALFPDSLYRTNHLSQSAFSLACFWRAPSDLVEFLRGHQSPLHQSNHEQELGSCATIHRILDLYPHAIYERNKMGELPLHSACRRGESHRVIRTLYQRYPGAISARDHQGNMPLHLACLVDNEKTIAFLLQKYQSAVRIPNFRGQLPMHLVCSADHVSLSVMKLVAEKNLFALKRPDMNGGLPIHVYCDGSPDSSMLLYLIHQNPSSCGVQDHIGNLPLHILVAKNTTIPPSSMLIQHLANRNKQSLTCRNSFGSLPLQLYLARQRVPTLAHVKCLGNRGASKESLESTRSAGGYTLLHMACISKASQEIIHYLLDQDGLDACQVRDKGGRLPLHYAHDSSTVQALFSRFPNGSYGRDNNGNTPLHVACLYGNRIHVLRALCGCNQQVVRTTNQDGDLPLHVACVAQSEEAVVEFLISMYPEAVGQRGKGGQLPLHSWFRDDRRVGDHFFRQGFERVLEQNLDALVLRDDEGFSPIHRAASTLDLDFIFLLLRFRPDVLL